MVRIFVPAACILAAFDSACAQESGIGASIRVGAAYTDNLTLEPAPDAISEPIAQISPMIFADYVKQRFTAKLIYIYDWYRYLDLGTTQNHQRYDALLTGELVDEVLFFDAGGSRTQSLSDPDDVIPGNNAFLSNNLIDRDVYFFGPRMMWELGKSVDVAGNYRYSEVRYSEGTAKDTTNQNANFKIDNLRNNVGVTWAGAYEWRETEYEVYLPFEYQRAWAELGYWVTGQTRVFGVYGKESPWDDPVESSLDDEFWEGGFAVANGERFTAEFAYGERAFGHSWRGRIAGTLRRGTLVMSYAETPRTNSERGLRRNALFDPDQPPDLLADPDAGDRFVSNEAQVSLILDFRRTSATLSAVHEERTDRFLGDGTPAPDQTQSGVRASITWQPAVRTQIVFTGSNFERETETAGKTDFVNASLEINYRLGMSTDLNLLYSYTEQQPDAGGFGRDYIANFIALYLTYTL